MSERNPQFPPLSKLQDIGQSKSWAAKIPERMRMALALADCEGAIPEEGFFSWESVRAYLSRVGNGILRGGASSLLVGVSAGADSVSLLLLLHATKLPRGFSSITCCHINHRLRGQESDLDMQYCGELSKHLDIDFVSTVADDKQAEAFRLQGSEERLREFRYAAFRSHAQQVGARIVAVAHTLNDQVETMLFRSFRGTSAAGLRGIPCVRMQDGILIVRPLIDVSRDQVIEFLRDVDITWREDSSNKQLHYSRNFIRSELVPRIESEFPDFGLRIETMRQLIADDEELLKALCLSQISQVEGKNANSWQLAKLEPLPVALKRRMFAQALRDRGIEVSFERVDKLVNMAVGNNQCESLDYSNPALRALSLNEKWDVVRRKEHLMFIDKEDETDDAPPADPIAVRIPGMTIVPALNKVMFVEALAPREKSPKKFPAHDAFEAVVSLTNVQTPLVIRERQPGDCIQPFGMQETVKLKKYLHTHKQEDEEPATGRRKLYVLASDEEVLWVPGVGISEKLRVTGRPTHTLKLLDIGIGESTLC